MIKKTKTGKYLMEATPHDIIEEASKVYGDMSLGEIVEWLKEEEDHIFYSYMWWDGLNKIAKQAEDHKEIRKSIERLAEMIRIQTDMALGYMMLEGDVDLAIKMSEIWNSEPSCMELEIPKN